MIDARGQPKLDKRVRSLVAHAPPRSLIVARGDGVVFGLWYERFVRNQRSDIDIVSRELLGQAWYQRGAPHFSPQMRWPERLQGDVDRRVADVIRANYAMRPVVVVANGDLPRACHRQPSGEIACEWAEARSEIGQEAAATAGRARARCTAAPGGWRRGRAGACAAPTRCG